MIKKVIGCLLMGLAMTAPFAVGTVTETKAAVQNAGFTYQSAWVNKKSVKSGETITAKAVTGGNAAGYKYKFVWSFNNWQSWGIIRQAGTNNSASFTPTKAGTYQVHIDAIAPNGKVTTKIANVTVGRGWNPVMSVSKINPKVGEAISVVGSASGAKDAQYKLVWQKDNWQSWGVISNFGSKRSTGFRASAPGTYELIIDVKDRYGNISTASKKINVSRGWNPAISVSNSNPKVGETISVVGSASGAQGAKYKLVWQKDNWQSWGVISNFGSKRSTGFRASAPGTYELIVDVKDKYGNVSSISKKINVGTGWSFTGITGVSNNATVDKGSSVSLKANTSGNTTGLKYKFVWSYNNWQSWGVISSGTNANAKWTPSAVGRYDIYVDAYDNYGNVITKSLRINSRQADNAQLEYKLLGLINTERAKNGLSSVSWDSRMDKAALIRGKELATSFSHTRPNGQSCFTAGEVGYAEIIAMAFSTEHSVELWMNSPGHRNIILTPEYKSISAAKYKNYWVVWFA